MKFFFLCVFLSTAILSLDTIAKNKDTIIALDSAYPPYMHGSKSKPKGLYANLLKEIFGKMKLSLTLEPKPWKRVMTKAKVGKWGVGGIYKNSERVKIFDYSEPIYYERLVLFTRKSSNIKFKKLSDLKGKVIGVDLLPIKPINENVTILQGDIRDEKVVNNILNEAGRKVDIILSDIAPNISGIWKIDHNNQIDLTRLIINRFPELLEKNGGCLLKAFDGPMLKPLENELRKNFTNVKLIKPKVSRNASSELYIACRNFR